jgi:hypothetical protein
MTPEEPQAAFMCKNCGDTMPESEIDSHECKSKICPRCNLKVAKDYFDRHTAIHTIAEKFSEKEMLANISATLTEIKSQNKTLIKLLVATLRG